MRVKNEADNLIRCIENVHSDVCITVQEQDEDKAVLIKENTQLRQQLADSVELPKDANGRVIRIGDELVDKTTKQPYMVDELLIDCNGKMYLFGEGGLDLPDNFVHAEDHKEPDTKLHDCPFFGSCVEGDNFEYIHCPSCVLYACFIESNTLAGELLIARALLKKRNTRRTKLS